MSLYLALNRATHDIYRPTAEDIANGATPGATRCDKGRYTVQQCKCRLLTALGEYLLDPRLGFLNREDFIKNYDQFGIEARARNIILSTYGVKSIITMRSIVLNREMTIQFKANTIFGEIELEVPWTIDPRKNLLTN